MFTLTVLSKIIILANIVKLRTGKNSSFANFGRGSGVNRDFYLNEQVEYAKEFLRYEKGSISVKICHKICH
ncbi:MAG: hypothetical protein ACOCYF_02275 [Bacteroidota bacterium]